MVAKLKSLVLTNTLTVDIGRIFSIFWQKIDNPNPSDMDIKLSIPKLHFS